MLSSIYLEKDLSEAGIRTHDEAVGNLSLYRLSYRGWMEKVFQISYYIVRAESMKLLPRAPPGRASYCFRRLRRRKQRYARPGGARGSSFIDCRCPEPKQRRGLRTFFFRAKIKKNILFFFIFGRQLNMTENKSVDKRWENPHPWE